MELACTLPLILSDSLVPVGERQEVSKFGFLPMFKSFTENWHIDMYNAGLLK